MSSRKGRDEGLSQGQVTTAERVRPQLPPMYRVVLLNDDYTPMEFVVWILESVFHKRHEEAVRVMLAVHRHGKGACGVYTYDVACTKAAQVQQLAQRHEHPLQCQLEAVEAG